MIELDYATVRPEAFPDLLARHHFAGRFDQSLEYLERLLLKPKSAPLLAQFSPLKIDFKRPKPQTSDRLATPPGMHLCVHRWIPSGLSVEESVPQTSTRRQNKQLSLYHRISA